MSKTRSGFFVMMPHRLATDDRVSHSAARLWCVLKVLEWQGEPPDNERLQGAMNATERSIHRWLRELEDCGWVNWDRKADVYRRYRAKSDSDATHEQRALAQIRQLLDSKFANLADVRAILESLGRQTPESVEQTPESVEQTPESDQQILRSVEQTPESVEQTPESVEQTPESVEQTPESVEQTPESDHRQFHGVTEPRVAAPRLLDSKTHEKRETPTTSTAASSSRTDPRAELLISEGIYPAKAAQILAAHPGITSADLRAAVDELAGRGAGPGAIAEMLLAAPPGRLLRRRAHSSPWSNLSADDRERYRAMGIRATTDPRDDEGL